MVDQTTGTFYIRWYYAFVLFLTIIEPLLVLIVCYDWSEFLGCNLHLLIKIEQDHPIYRHSLTHWELVCSLLQWSTLQTLKTHDKWNMGMCILPVGILNNGRYRDSITKSASGWRERWFSRSNTISDIGSEVRREVNAGIAVVSRMMERLDTRDGNGTGPSATSASGSGSQWGNVLGRTGTIVIC